MRVHERYGLIHVISFTEKGFYLSKKLRENLKRPQVKLFTRCSALLKEPEYYPGDIREFAADCFNKGIPILFIGATGIAVRAIAGCLQDKLKDVPVLVMDELNKHIIPLLSGHVGGGNELAYLISSVINAVPVITTATDINGIFSVDNFAVENELTIVNREGIAAASARVLRGEALVISSLNNGNREDLLFLRPKLYILGIGCKKGTSGDDILAFMKEFLDKAGIPPEDLYKITSVSIKREEAGIIEVSRKLRVPFQTYEPEELLTLEGSFRDSDFVKETVGVGNVCERSALLACRDGGELIMGKTVKNGITLALAKRHCFGIGL